VVNVKVKICGITNLKDALHAVEMGSDALGFIFYKNSARYISPEKARAIIAQLPPHVIKIGIFVNAREKTIKRIAGLCALDMLQFHGKESPEFCDRFNGYKIIKAFRIKDKIDYAQIVRYNSFAFLFDSFLPARLGGTGKKFDWRLISHINNIRRPIFLSGGLHVKNVKKAIGIAHPDWVDVSSSVELAPGKKDHKKVKKFIEVAKKASR
jgi:phosphoribosylanthranilate isomerase